MTTVRIKLGEWEPTEPDTKAVKIECWWDRFRRNWVLYPVNAAGDQLEEARYAFNRAEAQDLKKRMEQEYIH